MPTQFRPIPPVTTIDEVIAEIQTVVDWSIDNASRLGYFAALYKRITIAIKAAIAENLFDDGPRMERFDVTFASRYFAALNAYFFPDDYREISRCWRVAFDGTKLPEPIIVQHLLTGVNAHIDLDLGVAAEQVQPGKTLPSLHDDFYKVNAVLAGQVCGVLEEIDTLSPVLKEIYDVLRKHEMDLIDIGLRLQRDSAWDFAELLAKAPSVIDHPAIALRDVKVAALGRLILDPPELLEIVVKIIGAAESRDVVKNVRELDSIAETPAPMRRM